MQITVVDSRSQKGQYGIATESMILDTDEHGRILLMDGYGGNAVSGYMYRWEHGVAVQLRPDDTLDTIADIDDEIDPYNTIINRLIRGYDAGEGRGLLQWDGYVIAAMAKSAQS